MLQTHAALRQDPSVAHLLHPCPHRGTRRPSLDSPYGSSKRRARSDVITRSPKPPPTNPG